MSRYAFLRAGAVMRALIKSRRRALWGKGLTMVYRRPDGRLAVATFASRERAEGYASFQRTHPERGNRILFVK